MIASHQDGGTLRIALDRPAAANALNAAMHRELCAALTRAAADDAIRAVVLAASGDRAFSAGADLKEFSELDSGVAATRRREPLLQTLLAFLDFPKPVIAAVAAPAIGAGAMLALTCDEVLASDNCWIRFPEASLGLPSPIGIAIVEHRAGRRAAWQAIQLGTRIGALQALELGLVDQVVSADRLDDAVSARLAEWMAAPATPFAANKRWMNRRLRADLVAAAEERAREKP